MAPKSRGLTVTKEERYGGGIGGIGFQIRILGVTD